MRRDKTEIIRDILNQVLAGECKKTHITYKNNLNFRASREYLSLLLSKGLISVSAGKYKITESGITMLNLLNQVNIDLSGLTEAEA